MPADPTASTDWSKTAVGLGLARAPWTPSPEDGRLLLEAVTAHLAGRRSLVAVLGVTPALIQLTWPEGATILAVEANPAMIRSQWRSHPKIPSAVVCGRWETLPLPSGSVATVVGDGSLNALPYASYPGLFREVARVLAPAGVFVLRCFVRPEIPMEIAKIEQEVAGRRHLTSAPFRLRLCTALADSDGSLVLGSLLERFNAHFPDRRRLADAAGWEMAEVDRFDMDRGSKIELTFPTLAELAAHAQPYFAIEEVRHGSYPLAELCPRVTFVPTGAGASQPPR